MQYNDNFLEDLQNKLRMKDVKVCFLCARSGVRSQAVALNHQT